MGVYDRDYYRSDTPRGGMFGGMAPACKWIIGINIAVYIVQVVTRGPGMMEAGGITRWLDLDPVKLIGQFQLWRIVTYAFCHATETPWHIFFNMLFFWWFGHPLEVMYGSREFSKFYLAAAVVSGLCHMLLALFLRDLTPAIGASGAVMAVTMVYAMYYPRQIIYIFFIIPVELRWLVLFYIIVDLHPVLLALSGLQSSDGVAHAAHLGGLLYGFLYKHFDLRFSRLMADWSWQKFRRTVRTSVPSRSRASVRIYKPEEEPAARSESPREDKSSLDQRVDEILAKISSQGESSLTAEEREILKQASERYKRR